MAGERGESETLRRLITVTACSVVGFFFKSDSKGYTHTHTPSVFESHQTHSRWLRQRCLCVCVCVCVCAHHLCLSHKPTVKTVNLAAEIYHDKIVNEDYSSAKIWTSFYLGNKGHSLHLQPVLSTAAEVLPALSYHQWHSHLCQHNSSALNSHKTAKPHKLWIYR